VDGAQMSIVTAFESFRGDVINFIPPQKAPQFLLEAGLAGDAEWCGIDQATFESSFVPGVHVLGDAAIVGDMPKGSYEVSDEEAVRNAMRFIKESGCDAVKREGVNEKILSRVKSIVDSGIVVIGHIGLTPQSLAQQGGYRVVGRDKKEILSLQDGVDSLINSGVFSILLEALPPDLAQKISEKSDVIIFGIGAGKYVHGQLLILHDLIGLYPDFRPKFAKCFVPQVINSYIENKKSVFEKNEAFKVDGIYSISKLAIESFILEVKSGEFPSDEFSYKNN
jgi:3-methyl-2-oxobutanoate hydroxymethyltransferase